MLDNDDASPVVVTAESRALVRRLGPTGWAVLEDVVLAGRPQNGRWLARTSTRRVAEHLGLTPGTVARALARLCSEGIVHREDRRDSNTGRFGESVYVVADVVGLRPYVDLPLTGDLDTGSRHTAAPPMEDRHTGPAAQNEPRGAAPGRRRAPVSEQQLLIADDAAVTTPPLAVNPANPGSTKPRTPNHQAPEPHNTQPQDPYNSESLNTTNQRATDTCHPSGKALPGAAAFTPEAGSC